MDSIISLPAITAKTFTIEVRNDNGEWKFFWEHNNYVDAQWMEDQLVLDCGMDIKSVRLVHNE